jgi:hypothetical protein
MKTMSCQRLQQVSGGHIPVMDYSPFFPGRSRSGQSSSRAPERGFLAAFRRFFHILPTT